MTENRDGCFEPEWIALALSGGGFRATLFHLGVLKALFELNLLHKVKLICSASGGSILGAHLVLNWENYIQSDKTFDAAANEIIKFVKSDVRNRIFSKYVCGGILVLPWLLGKWKLPDLLQQKYDELFGNACFADLKACTRQPEIHILATSLTTGALCRFTNSEFEILSDEHTRVSITQLKVSLAVAASSAFPPFFPPVIMNHEVLKCHERQFYTTHFLADGGIFDNLALEELLRVAAEWPREKGILIVSNASSNFDWRIGKKYASLLSLPRNIRANEIMMQRISTLEMRICEDGCPEICKIEIGKELSQRDNPEALPVEMQRAIWNIRTDLDRFSDTEVSALIWQGYVEARSALGQKGIALQQKLSSIPLGHIPKPESTELGVVEAARRQRWVRLGLPVWGVVASILLWICTAWILSFAGTLWEHRYEFRQQEATQAHLREAASAYEQAKNEVEQKLGMRVYAVQIMDAANRPVANAKVRVTFDDSSGVKQEGRTDPKGFFHFTADGAEPSGVHLHVDAPEFLALDEIFILNQEPVHRVTLNQAD